MPNLDLVRTAYKLLIQYGIFRWSKKDGFHITPHDGAQFKAFTIQAVKDKRLIKGGWRERTWTGFVALSRLVRTYLEHNIRYGTWSFDMVIARSLSVVLVSSLASRSGDVARSDKYVGAQYLHYKHIDLYLGEAGAAGGGPPGFQDLQAVITLDYCKGQKDVENQSTVRYLRPLDIQSVHVCPIALLLVHALRHGLVHGTTIGEVLARAAARPDLHVEWKYPERPVLSAFARGPTRCDLDTVATPAQVCSTVKIMGLISGMLSRAYSHSLRLGAIRDYAHISKTSAQASLPSTEETRRFAGHHFSSMQRGVTDGYVGDVAQYYYNARAEDGGVHHGRDPKFAVGGGGEAYWDMIQKPLQPAEIQAYVDEYKPGREPASLTRWEQRTMKDRVRHKRAEALPAEPTGRRRQTASNMVVAAAAPEPPPPPPPPPRRSSSVIPQPQTRSHTRSMPPSPAPAEAARSTTNKPHAGRDDNDDDLFEAGPEAHIDVSSSRGARQSGRVSAAAAAATSTASGQGAAASGQGAAASSEDLDFLSKIDPALLDEDTLASLNVDNADVSALEAVIIPGAVGVQQGGKAAEEGDGVAGQAAQDIDIEEAARVLLGQEEPQGDQTASNSHAGWIDGYARYNVVNNVRFALAWKPFSEGKVPFEDSIGRHSVRGNSREEPTPWVFHCQRTEGCEFSTILKPVLVNHELACSTTLVEARAAAREEVEPDANNILRCTHPGCTFQTSSGRKALNHHVRRQHNYTPQECEDCDDGVIYQTLDALNKHKTNVHSGRWPSGCLFPGCLATREFPSHGSLVYHLRTKHGLSTPESYQPYLPPYPEKKQWVKQECVVATCTNKTLYTKRDGMIQHVKTKHGMDYKEASELVDREARTETVVPKARILGLADRNKKQSNQQASPVAPGKENDPPAALDGVQERPGEHGIGGGAEPKLKKPRVKKS